MQEHLLQLKAVLTAIEPLNEPEWEAFSAIWTPFSAKRKEVISRAGETEKYLYFVLEGVQRIFYFDAEGREATLVFMYPPSFGGVFHSFLLQEPSRQSFETLTPSYFLRASFPDFDRVVKMYPALQALILKGVSQALSGVLDRLAELQSFTSEEKFKTLLSRSPHILHLVPHKYLANYIGIDATNFSKLINRIKI
ncbi:MAG TPA: Crp/Fnr family transcriptional regulator [Pedobacter sp.]|jgi:CRP-like cAMP-binding protein